MFIEVDGLTKNYYIGNVKVSALRDVSFTLEKGGFYVILGPSGSGYVYYFLFPIASDNICPFFNHYC